MSIVEHELFLHPSTEKVSVQISSIKISEVNCLDLELATHAFPVQHFGNIAERDEDDIRRGAYFGTSQAVILCLNVLLRCDFCERLRLFDGVCIISSIGACIQRCTEKKLETRVEI